jgi:hypothetical protein
MLQVIGAGLGRTGTLSLKTALERLLGAPCYHMLEVFGHLDDHVPLLHAAVRGEPVDWDLLFDGYVAAVDWPVCSFWPELTAEYPEALVILSVRDAESWWRSASTTIFPTSRQFANDAPEWWAMMNDLFTTRFTMALDDRDACIAAFEANNARVRAEVPASRLLEWTATDGWAPLCDALHVPIPDEPFPRVNTSEEFLGRRQ